jgi:hypothetical protein
VDILLDLFRRNTRIDEEDAEEKPSIARTIAKYK